MFDAITNLATELAANPLVWKVMLAYWLFSAVVGAMPTPRDASSLWYVFAFRLAHGLSGNLNRAAVALKVPGVAASGQANATSAGKP